MKKIKFPKLKVKNKKRFVILSSVAVVVLTITAIIIIIGQITKPLPYEFAIAKKQTIIQEVSITGKVKPAQAVDLAFEKSGKIKNVFVNIGDLVQENDNLVAMETLELQAQLAQAKANLESQTAALAELQAGTRIEEIDIAKTAVNNAQKALADAQSKATTDLANLYNSVINTLGDAYIKSDDAVNKQTQELFINANTNSPQLTFYCSNAQLTVDSQSKRALANIALLELKTISSNNSFDFNFLDNALIKATNNLNQISSFLNTTDSALNYANLTSSQITTYKSYLNIGRANINTALTNVNSLKQSIASQKITNQQNITTAQNALESAQKNLTLKQAGATQEQIQAQLAQVKSAKANVDNISAQIAKSIIKAPFSGIITQQEAKIGQIAQAGATIVSLISQTEFEVEANVPEADIAKVAIGNTAKITLDAYGNDIKFQAKVVKVNPSETIIEGIATYKTTLQFLEKNERIKSGFTANIDILTNQKENVLAVPYRAVITKNGDKIIKVLKGKNIEERKVIVGLKGSDGYVEITQGLREGEKIITFEKK